MITNDEDDVHQADRNSISSTLRERILEHVFVGDLLRSLWRRGITRVEVLRSVFDGGGYDLAFGIGHLVRHVQLKSTLVAGKATDTTISLDLADKQSGCVVWMLVDPGLEIVTYLWSGAEAGHALPAIDQYPVKLHSKGNKYGVKLPRPRQRCVPKSAFTKLSSLEDLIGRLFGDHVQSSAEVIKVKEERSERGSCDAPSPSPPEDNTIPPTPGDARRLSGELTRYIEKLLLEPGLDYYSIVKNVRFRYPNARTSTRSLASIATAMRTKGFNVPYRT